MRRSRFGRREPFLHDLNATLLIETLREETCKLLRMAIDRLLAVLSSPVIQSGADQVDNLVWVKISRHRVTKCQSKLI